jgi:type I pantothenate kinase
LSKAASSLYLDFERADWAALRADTPLTLAEDELEQLRGTNESVSLDEVVEIYLPLSRLLNLYVAATQDLYRATATFLNRPEPKVPYVIGMAGSVAVGKSTTARILQALLSRWPNHPRVDRITTDGFLWPLEVLEARGLMRRKGFPESYDRRRLVRFLSDVKAGVAGVEVPVYSHITYDIVPGSFTRIDQPDIVIVEGVNVLQTGEPGRQPHVFVSDFFDFSIYVDAEIEVVKSWYVNRFLTFRETAFKSADAYFHRFSKLTDAEARETASSIWEEINAVNLRQNIAPTRERARLVLRKGADHSVERVRLRKL